MVSIGLVQYQWKMGLEALPLVGKKYMLDAKVPQKQSREESPSQDCSFRGLGILEKDRQKR